MLTEEKLKELPPKAAEFYRKANAFRLKNGTELEVITAWSAEHDQWAAYFQANGWMPFAIRQLEKSLIKTMTMPTRIPEWFDPDYIAPAVIKRRQPDPSLTMHTVKNQRLAKMLRDLAETLKSRNRKPPPKSMVDEFKAQIGNAAWDAIPDAPR